MLLVEELRDLYNLCNIVGKVKYKRLRLNIVRIFFGGGEKCEESLDGQTSWKMATLETEKGDKNVT